MEIDAKTKLCCLIGNPVEHSLGPAIHNASFEKLNLNFIYLAFPVDNVEFAVHGIRALNIAGASVTIPHKSAVAHYLDRLDSLSEKIGAVNTIVNEGGRLVGYNTDCKAAISAIEKKTRIHNKKTVILGAGGLGRAIAFGAKDFGASVFIADIDSKKAGQLAESVGCSVISLDELEKSSTIDILINATPVGMFPKVNEMPVSKKVLQKDMVVFDAVYNPLKTKLLDEAEKAGCRTVSGIEMFTLQAGKQFELWTGSKAPLEFMRETAMKYVRGELPLKKEIVAEEPGETIAFKPKSYVKISGKPKVKVKPVKVKKKK